MERKSVKGTLDEFVKYLQKSNNINIHTIAIKDYDIYRFNEEIISKEEITSFDQPINLMEEENGYCLYINEDYYLTHEKVIREIICNTIKKTLSTNLTIDDNVLITDDIIKSICDNKNIKEVFLDAYNDSEYRYKLTEKHYHMFKQSMVDSVCTNGVCEELKDNYDSLIITNSKKFLIGYYNYDDLTTNEILTIYQNDFNSEKSLDNIKYINESAKIYIKYDDINFLSCFINKIKEYKKSNKIIISIENLQKEDLTSYLLQNNIVDNNIFILTSVMGEGIHVKDYLNFEKIIYNFLNGIEKVSPFEQFICSYNISKSFKKYKSNDNDLYASRNLYEILFNEYMVCTGYSIMLGDLLTKLGIENYNCSVNIDISYDDYLKGNENLDVVKPAKFVGHSRRYVHIVDPKYNIDGIFISDPTWDNILEKDYYNYLAMTPNEETGTVRYSKLDIYGVSDLLNVNCVEDFYNKVNFLLKNISLMQIIQELLKYINNLDIKFYQSLCSKYKGINKNYYDSLLVDENELITDIAYYVVEHVNRPIDGNTIMRAVKEVYKQFYGYSIDKIDSVVEKVIEDNKNRQERAFPTRYKESEDGLKKIIMNETNKFDIQIDSKKK